MSSTAGNNPEDNVGVQQKVAGAIFKGVTISRAQNQGRGQETQLLEKFAVESRPQFSSQEQLHELLDAPSISDRNTLNCLKGRGICIAVKSVASHESLSRFNTNDTFEGETTDKKIAVIQHKNAGVRLNLVKDCSIVTQKTLSENSSNTECLQKTFVADNSASDVHYSENNVKSVNQLKTNTSDANNTLQDLCVSHYPSILKKSTDVTYSGKKSISVNCQRKLNFLQDKTLKNNKDIPIESSHSICTESFKYKELQLNSAITETSFTNSLNNTSINEQKNNFCLNFSDSIEAGTDDKNLEIEQQTAFTQCTSSQFSDYYTGNFSKLTTEETSQASVPKKSHNSDLAFLNECSSNKLLSKNTSASNAVSVRGFNKCSFCSVVFSSGVELCTHFRECHLENTNLGNFDSSSNSSVSNCSEAQELISLKCIKCDISTFLNCSEYIRHHTIHAKADLLWPSLNKLNDQKNNSTVTRTNVKEKLKFIFKILKVSGSRRGHPKKRTVFIEKASENIKDFTLSEDISGSSIANENNYKMSKDIQGQSPGLPENNKDNHSNESLEQNVSSKEMCGPELQEKVPNLQDNIGESSSETVMQDTSTHVSNETSNVILDIGGARNEFGPSAPNETPPSTYEPPFDSFSGDWFGDYDSNSRIAAAMTGSQHTEENQPSSWPNGHSVSPSNPSNNREFDPSLNSTAGTPRSEHSQGSFEQLCLNDTFSSSDSQNISNSNINQIPQGGDIMSDLDYLNSGVTGMQENMSDSHSNSRSASSSRSSHSSAGTPTGSAGHPTPPPQPATDPLVSSPHGSSFSPSLHCGSPLPPSKAQPSFSQSSVQQEVVTPRLTIASNLMASPTVASEREPGYTQWSQPPVTVNNSSPTFRPVYPRMPGVTQNRGIAPSSIYQASPPARFRGRPPVMGQIGRGTNRGPGRPPGSLMAARGSVIPLLQGQPQYQSGIRQPVQKRIGTSSHQSPSKRLREELAVPNRQKDNECEIIAVANRSSGINCSISSVQGSAHEDRSNTAQASNAIHLSDSITLSVRHNEGKSDKNGPESGVVANLLASRGITVTPAAGEKESTKEENRRLPTASELNLSSAISVHPPTSRDRDGFTVPAPPSRSSGSVNQIERPPRPPTVDLTQDVSATGAMATRHACSQCDRTFPTAMLLADHSKLHQQQQSTRMPYKCHLCTAGFSSQKLQYAHYHNFHQLQLSANDIAIPIIDLKNGTTIQKMAALGIRSFLPLSNLQNRGAGSSVGIPILTFENIRLGINTLQQWGVTDILNFGPPKTLNMSRFQTPGNVIRGRRP